MTEKNDENKHLGIRNREDIDTLKIAEEIAQAYRAFYDALRSGAPVPSSDAVLGAVTYLIEAKYNFKGLLL